MSSKMMKGVDVRHGPTWIRELLRNGRWAWLAGVVWALSTPCCEAADAPMSPISIDAQPLGAALRAFAQQTHLQLVYVTDLTRGVETRGCSAALTPSDALRQLLSGTRLAFRFLNDNTVQIRSATAGGSRDATADKDGDRDGGRVRTGAFSAEDAQNLTEVIVTARKRPERRLDVPMAMTVVSGESLEMQGINPLSEVLQDVPSRSVIELGSGRDVVHARGVATSLGANEIGYYLDDLPFTGTTVSVEPDVRTWDISRVEVLRGPQGTLFGEGSVSGSVRVITRDPQFDEWDVAGGVQVSGARDGGSGHAYEGLVNVPLVENRLALRLSGSKENIPGWVDDVVTGQKDVNSQDIVASRARLLFQPTDKLTLNASWWRYDGNFPRANIVTDELTAPQTAKVDVEMSYSLEGLSATYDFGPVTAFYSFGHNSIAYPQSGRIFGAAFLNSIDFRIDSNELRFSSTGASSWKWTAGIYDFRANRLDVLRYAPFTVENTGSTQARSQAFFGEATYRFSGLPLDLSVGTRLAREMLEGHDTNYGEPTAALRKTYSSVNPRVSASWHVAQDALVYASAAKGYRAGQLQSSVAIAQAVASGIQLPAVLRDSSIWNYEIGTSASLGQQVSLDAAVFRSIWDYPLVQVRLPTPGLTGLINAGRTITDGVEASSSLKLTDAWSFTIGGGYRKTRHALAVPDIGSVIAGNAGDVVSRKTANAALEWRRPLFAGLTGTGRMAFQHSSPRPSYTIGAPSAQAGDAITMVDARLGAQGRRWSLYLFADNLSNEHGAAGPRTLSQIPGRALEIYAPRLPPLTVGLEFTMGLRSIE
ncbi:MAG: TonB-dependent receptor [Gammaproteobacteria bacterium]